MPEDKRGVRAGLRYRAAESSAGRGLPGAWGSRRPRCVRSTLCYKRVPRETVCLFYKYVCTAVQSAVGPEATAPGRNLTNPRKWPSVKRPSHSYTGVYVWGVWRPEDSFGSQFSPSVTWILGLNSGCQCWWQASPPSQPHGPYLTLSVCFSLFSFSTLFLIFIYFLSQSLTL